MLDIHAPQKPLKLAYLMNTYPMNSTTFVRGEIHALEALGHEVKRYAIRPWSESLNDRKDQDEQRITHYLISGRSLGLLGDLVREAISNPKGMLSALAAWGVLLGNAKSGLVRHVAYFLEAVSLKRALQRDGVEHLHAHFSTNTAAVALMAHRLGGPGFSFTVHGPDEFVNWGPGSLKFKVAEAEFVVAISEFCRVQIALAVGHTYWDKIKIVRCGVDLQNFPVSDAAFDATSPFVCVGRLCPQKAQTLIVEAIAKVAKVHPDVQLVLVGDGETRPLIEAAIASHGLQNNITMVGWCNNQEVREILGRARALLLPSFAEGLPVVIMEAFALGRPAISTYIAGIPELVDRDCGWVIPAGSTEHIVQAILQALDTSEENLAALGQRGRDKVEDNHDIDKNAMRLKSLFDSSVKRDRPPRARLKLSNEGG